MAELEDVRILKNLACVFPALLCAVAAFGQNRATDPCPFTPSNNGVEVTVRGRVIRRPHDMVLAIPSCKETAVLVYAGSLDGLYAVSSTTINLPRATRVEGDGDLSLRKDRDFRRFVKDVDASYKSTRRHSRSECWKYEVQAEFTGRLDVTETAGLVRDENSQKIVGMDGFGHPTPFTRYRFVMVSVSDLRARKLPK